MKSDSENSTINSSSINRSHLPEFTAANSDADHHLQSDKTVDFTINKSRKRGQLKIFFGYAAGTGKTYTMLEAAHQAQKNGIDVVVGYVEPHARAETMALMEGLEILPLYETDYKGIHLKDLDLDGALTRSPRLIVVDELAHTNAPGMRHTRRYQDIEELLRQGIDVYTTMNVQHLESLCDSIAAITSIVVQERVPDRIFDEASQVELVDLEPAELMERFEAGKVYVPEQAALAKAHFFNDKNLQALREIALRRCADRVSMMEDAMLHIHNTRERILVCLSSSPSNARIIRTAARMAQAFHGSLHALYVETPNDQEMSEANKKRLRDNAALAQSLGAVIETVYGENVALQIAEYARACNASKLVLGRSNVKSKWWGKPVLTEQLIALAPDLDMYIIPDQSIGRSRPRMAVTGLKGWFHLTWRDLLYIEMILAGAVLAGFVFARTGLEQTNIITIFLLSVLICAMTTASRMAALISALLATLAFNFFFTTPQFSFNFEAAEYGATFAIMFAGGLLAGSLAHRLKENAAASAASSWRFQVLFETSQKLQQAQTAEEIFILTGQALESMFHYPVVIYPCSRLTADAQQKEKDHTVSGTAAAAASARSGTFKGFSSADIKSFRPRDIQAANTGSARNCEAHCADLTLDLVEATSDPVKTATSPDAGPKGCSASRAQAQSENASSCTSQKLLFKTDQALKPVPYVFGDPEEKPGENGFAIACWVAANNKRAGAGTRTLASSPWQFLAIRKNDQVFGVCGIFLQDQILDASDASLIEAILSESAMALDLLETAELKEEAAILARNEQMQANLLRSISHDLRTPLTSISGSSAMLLQNSGQLSEKRQKQLLMDIQKDSIWLKNLVENLLAMTKIEDGTVALRKEPEMMEELIEEAVAQAERWKGNRQIILEDDESFELVEADARLMVQVLINLLDNAIKYSPDGSQILIRSKVSGSSQIVEVCDQGVGIPDADKAHIFERFYQAVHHHKADAARSLGLGLALCQGIIQVHSGEIEVYDNKPAGTVFQIRLPLYHPR